MPYFASQPPLLPHPPTWHFRPCARLVAIYCCEAADPEEEVSPYIPDQWPPPLPAPASEAVPVPIPQQHTPGGVSPGTELLTGVLPTAGANGSPAGAASNPKSAVGGRSHKGRQ